MSAIPALRPVLRRLARTPFWTGLAILTLAPGLGAHLAIFNLVDVLFLRPLPIAEPERVVGVYETRGGEGSFPLSLPDALDYRAATRTFGVFSDLAAHYPTAPLSLETASGSVELNGSVVSANYFSVLGITPALGRFLLPEDDAAPGPAPAVVLSHSLWRARFGGRRALLGQIVRLNGNPFTVVGVAPPGFPGVLSGIPSDVWLPTSRAAVGYRWCDPRSRDCTWLDLIGRLAPGHSLAEAQGEMSALSAGLRQAHPSPHAEPAARGVRVAPLRGVHPGARADTLRLAALLSGAVTLVLAIAAANLCSLLLARSLPRRQEIAIRLALGVSRRSLVTPFVAEALLLALAGGALGLLLATWIGRAIVVLYPSDVPLDLPLGLQGIVYVALLALATGLLVGLVPGLEATRPRLAPVLQEGGRTTAGGRPRLLALLLVAQVALSFVLLTGTGLLARSATRALHGGGIDPRGVLTLRLRPRLVGYGPVQAQAYSREALRRLANLPGVRSVSLGVALPPWPPGGAVPVERPGASGGANPTLAAQVGEIAPRFFATFGAPLLRGRDFDDRDTGTRAPVAIVNSTLARRLWPQGNALGERLIVDGKTYEVVGLAPDLGTRTSLEPPAAQVYLPYWQDPTQVDARLAIRATGDPAPLLPALRRELRALDPAVPVFEVELLPRSLEHYLAPTLVAGRVLGLAAALALFLSTLGLYGTLSLAVAQSTRDIGIRIALGASRRQAVAQVAQETARLLTVALALGFATALGTGNLLAHYLYGVSPRDPLTFGGALVALALTAVLASWVPARRASRVDPVVALKAG